MKTAILARVLTMSLLFSVAVQSQDAATAPQKSNAPPNGFVPDSATAVRIAEAVLIPVYGEKVVLAERPYTAKLQSDVWTVSGTLHCPQDPKKDFVCDGGTAVVKLSKRNGQIFDVVHYK